MSEADDLQGKKVRTWWGGGVAGLRSLVMRRRWEDGSKGGWDRWDEWCWWVRLGRRVGTRVGVGGVARPGVGGRGWCGRS